MKNMTKAVLATWVLSWTLALGCGGSGNTIEPAAAPAPPPATGPAAASGGGSGGAPQPPPPPPVSP